MIDKAKNVLTIVLIVIFIIAVIYSLISVVVSLFSKPQLITSENIEQYVISENIVTGYNTFNFMEACVNNFMDACSQQKYEELYSIYIDKYKDTYSKEEIMNKLKNIGDKFNNSDIDNKVEYKLATTYKAGEEYILEIELDDKILRMIFSETIDEQTDYEFAFIK